MKFAPTRETVLTTGQSVGFSMAINAKSFSILTSGIYKNKIKAIIREYSTNAFDAHLEAGITVPFEVHLPTRKNPYFYVRDFGFGLDEDQFENVFFKFFESTKDQSNVYNGTMGLGSKSFASYHTKSCTVESIKNGKKFIYAAYIGQTGCPERSLLYSGETDEPSGLKVQIPVNEDDIDEFISNAELVYQWFSTKPTFIGGELKLSTEDEFYREKTDNYGLLHNRGVFAVMSNVAYPIEHHFALSQYSHFIKNGSIVLFFENGEISFTPSRESLEYTDRTLNAIKSKFQSVVNEIKDKIKDRVSTSKNEWEAICNYNQNYSLYSSTFSGLLPIKEEKFNFDGKELNSKGLEIDGKTVLVVPSHNKHYYNNVMYIDGKNKYVIDDLKIGSISRCKLLAGNNYGSKVYLLSKDYFDSIPLTKDDSMFIMASSLPKPVRSTTTYTRSKFTELNFMRNQDRLIDAWESVEIKDAESKYYVLKNGYRPAYYGDSRDINHNVTPRSVYRMAENAGIKDKIYAVSPKNEAKIIKQGFIKIQDAIVASQAVVLKEVQDKTQFIHENRAISTFCADNYQFVTNLLKLKAAKYKLPDDLEEILKLKQSAVDNFDKLKDLENKISGLARCLNNFSFEEDKNPLKFTNEEKIIEKYPLLEQFSVSGSYTYSISLESFFHYISGVNYVCSNV